MKRIYLFDTTLRDGCQTKGVDFSVADKIAITEELDSIGIDYIDNNKDKFPFNSLFMLCRLHI